MESLPNNFSGWLWWVFSVLFLGVLINLVSTLLYPRFENFLSKFSKKIREKQSRRKFKREALLADLINNPNKLIMLKLDLIILYIESVLLLVFLFATIIGSIQFSDVYFKFYDYTKFSVFLYAISPIFFSLVFIVSSIIFFRKIYNIKDLLRSIQKLNR